jgi:hypothetical protein
MLSSSYRPLTSADNDDHLYENPFHQLEANFQTFDENLPNQPVEKSPSTSSYIRYGLIAMCACLVVVLGFSYRSSSSISSTSTMVYRPIDLATESTYTIEVLVSSNDYGQIKSLDYLPWDVVAEPYQDQIFSINSFVVDGESISIDNSDYDITWSIDGEDYSGSQVTINLEKTGMLSGSVSIEPRTTSSFYGKRLKSAASRTTPKRKLRSDYNPAVYKSEVSSSYDLDFMIGAKYVRREIRQLTDTDRTTVLQTMKMLYDLSEDDGQALYGDKYHSAEYFAAKHLYGGGQTDCDHWHDGAGIAVTHIAFTLEYEQALQSINPSISLPYWEYSQDSYLYSSLYESPIFDSDWFGEMNPQNADHTLSDNSVWSTIKVPSGENYKDWDAASVGSLNPYVNAYNQLRSPWNNNPSSYIGRSNTTYGEASFSSYPSCVALYEAFNVTTLKELNYYLNGETHGPAHIIIGGSWTTADDTSMDDFDYLKRSWKILFFKVLWRMGITRCPSNCTSTESCRCSVPDAYLDEYGAYALLQQAYTLYPIMARGYIDSIGSHSESFYTSILKAVEHPGNAGEMYSSNAAWDPLFWLIHGTMERIMGLKRVLVSQGDVTSFDEAWGYTAWDKYDGDVYLNGRCDWSEVSDVEDLTLPSCSSNFTCSGHAADDTMSFSNFLGKDETYTNRDFYDFIHPWNDDLPYVFESLDFDYCIDFAGVDFLDGIVDEMVYKGFAKDRSMKHAEV